MAKMHKDELDINESLVKSLLKHQCPQWADLPIKALASTGTDNALFRLGSEYIVRLPRIEWAPGSADRGINKEYEWVPHISTLLKTDISVPLFKGNPDNAYPWSWIVSRWNEGQNPDFEQDNEYEELAIDLANFLNDLHAIKLPKGPLSRRGISLKEPKLDLETKKAISALEKDEDINKEIDIESVKTVWEQLSNTPIWDIEPVWLHGDFLPRNILVQNNASNENPKTKPETQLKNNHQDKVRLSAVIDFSDVGIGDLACDLIIAWCLFNTNSRNIFKSHLKNVDENTWQRGKGWALSIGLIMLPYYKNSNPVLARLARQLIKNILTHSKVQN